MQLDNTHINVNNLKNDPMTGITNCTTRCREEATLKTLEKVEMWWRAQPSRCGQQSGARTSSVEKGEKQLITLGSLHSEDKFP